MSVKSPPLHLNQLQTLQCLSKSHSKRSKRCDARRNRVSDIENGLGTVYFYLFIIFISRARFRTTKHMRILELQNACAFYNYKMRARFVVI